MTRASSIQRRFSPRIETLEDRTLLATCTVTNLLDVGRGGISFGSGQVSGDLRFCINYANNLPGHDTIRLDLSGTINLTRALPALSTDMNIVGPGPALTVRRDTGGNYRIFTVPAGAVVRISGLTATKGNLTSGQGGGIYNAGTLTLIDVNVTGNVVGTQFGTNGAGGGIYNSGSLLLQDSTISYNHANNAQSNSVRGGGIFNAGSLTVINSSIFGNYTESREESFYNAVTEGAGVFNSGTAVITYSTIAGNSATSISYGPTARGAGIYSSGPLTIANSTVRANHANGFNLGDSWSVALGGGIYGADISIHNSTIAENWATTGCGTSKCNEGDDMGGSGIYLRGNGVGVITHSTIAVNTGEDISINGPLTLRNSIVESLQGTITSSGYNLFHNSAGGSGYVPSDILDVNPKLGPLQHNGGPTLTMALLPGSPAIDAGDNADAPEWDQRGPGFPRIVNGTIDIGAFEVQATGAPATAGGLAVLITALFEDPND